MKERSSQLRCSFKTKVSPVIVTSYGLIRIDPGKRKKIAKLSKRVKDLIQNLSYLYCVRCKYFNIFSILQTLNRTQSKEQAYTFIC
jgi:hypothetical protein